MAVTGGLHRLRFQTSFRCNGGQGPLPESRDQKRYDQCAESVENVRIQETMMHAGEAVRDPQCSIGDRIKLLAGPARDFHRACAGSLRENADQPFRGCLPQLWA